MPPRIFAKVEPALLIWGRETAGLSIESAARKIGVSPERLTTWEGGTDVASVSQLRRIAAAYKRPLAIFFLPTPPLQAALPHDFRSLAAGEAGQSPELLLELRRARRRRNIALEIAREGDQDVADFPIAADLRADPDELAGGIRDWLAVTTQKQSGWRGEYGSLNGWLSLVETRQVLVFQTGDVSLNQMRGFSISEYPLPAIVLNAADAPRGRVFTLAHELVHLCLRNGGVCDPSRVGAVGRSPDERVEVFCNRVAGAVLVPADDLLNQPSVQPAGRREWAEPTLRALADRYAVSRDVVLRRLLILERTTEAFYEVKHEEYRQQFLEFKARAKEERGFAPYSRVVVRDNGRQYTKLILEALDRSQITPADVSDYLGVNLKHLSDIAEAVQSPGNDV